MNLTLLITLLFVAFTAQAKTASEIYEQASKSTVLVLNLDEKGEPQSRGSGVVFTKGNVVTNCHVVKDAGGLKVHSGNKEYSATLQYSDWDRDVCSLSIAGLDAPAVVVGSTKTLKVGAKVYAIGAPKGLELTLSDGIVSSLREVEGGHYIQTTAAISPGSSGGGLFDENGALVGLTTFYFTEGQNLNFAVPIEWVNELAQRSVKALATAQPVTEWLNKSIELENRKDWPALLEHCRRWTKAQPDSSLAWYILGHAYSKVDQYPKAIEAYKKGLRINPEYAEVWNDLGLAYDKIGQTNQALGAYKQALRVDPEVAAAWYNLGTTYIKAGQFFKAIETLQQFLRLQPEDSGAWYILGHAYSKVDQYPKAIEAHQQALRINPEFTEAWIGLGVAYSKSGQRGQAVVVYKRLKTLNPALAEQFFNEVVIP